jgi:hypothetical protein
VTWREHSFASNTLGLRPEHSHQRQSNDPDHSRVTSTREIRVDINGLLISKPQCLSLGKDKETPGCRFLPQAQSKLKSFASSYAIFMP